MTRRFRWSKQQQRRVKVRDGDRSVGRGGESGKRAVSATFRPTVERLRATHPSGLVPVRAGTCAERGSASLWSRSALAAVRMRGKDGRAGAGTGAGSERGAGLTGTGLLLQNSLLLDCVRWSAHCVLRLSSDLVRREDEAVQPPSRTARIIDRMDKARSTRPQSLSSLRRWYF